MSGWTPRVLPALLLALSVVACAAPRAVREDANATPPTSAPADAGPMLAAAREGDLDAVRGWVEAGRPVDAVDRYDTTALMMAARGGHLEVARYLLEHGADPEHGEAFFGSTPLAAALRREQWELAVLLLRAGADGREAALEAALAAGRLDVARAAVESGPIHESVLAALGERAADAGDDFAAVLARATSRPDPAPPDYTAQQLERFAGAYEGWDSDRRVEVALESDRLSAAIDGGEPALLDVTGDAEFSAAEGDVELSFWGRWGTIEAVVLRLGAGAPENLRRSVAEPAGAAAFAGAPQADAAPSAPVVDWPGFRGPRASGIGDGADVPESWDAATGAALLWRTALPGLGNSSPIVWGDRVFVTTAVADSLEQELRTGLTGSGEAVDEPVEHRWLVLAFDKWTGAELWRREVGRGIPQAQRHFKASQANSTPVTDGRYLVAVFPTAGMTCLDLDGNVRWRHELGALRVGAPGDPGSEWGFASSPVIRGARVFLQADLHADSYVAAWELASGRRLWRTARNEAPSWATPNVLPAAAGDELVLNGSRIRGYDPETGDELWNLGPNSELVIATPVVGESAAYVSAGYAPVKPIYALRAGLRGALDVDPDGGDERLMWSHGRGGAYMPTPLLYRGLLYVVHHNGRIVAYDAQSGTAIYKERFSRGGTFTASPVAANGKLYVSTEEGLMYVLAAGPTYRELAINEFGEPLMATPALSEGLLLVRTPSHLAAIGRGRDER